MQVGGLFWTVSDTADVGGGGADVDGFWYCRFGGLSWTVSDTAGWGADLDGFWYCRTVIAIRQDYLPGADLGVARHPYFYL